MTDDNRPLPQLTPVQHVLYSIEILSQDVSDVLCNLNSNKSDLVSPRLLKAAGSVLARPLSMIFRVIFQVIRSMALCAQFITRKI